MNKFIVWAVIFLALSGNALALTNSAPVTSQILDSSGNALTSTGNALDVNIKTSGATVTVTPLTNSSVVKAQLQDNGGTAITLGQKAMSSSVPVVLSSDQAAIPVTMSPSFSTRADTFTTTSSGTTVDSHLAPMKSFSLAVKATGAVTSWTVLLECSLDNTNFTTVLTHTNTTPGDGQILFAGTTLTPCLYFRSRASALTLGGGTNVVATILGM
jgi:hypothetical protein